MHDNTLGAPVIISRENTYAEWWIEHCFGGACDEGVDFHIGIDVKADGASALAHLNLSRKELKQLRKDIKRILKGEA